MYYTLQYIAIYVLQHALASQLQVSSYYTAKTRPLVNWDIQPSTYLTTVFYMFLLSFQKPIFKYIMYSVFTNHILQYSNLIIATHSKAICNMALNHMVFHLYPSISKNNIIISVM